MPEIDIILYHGGPLKNANASKGLPFEVGMTIFARPAGTRLGLTLMGRVLPGSIRNRVGYGFLNKKLKWVRVLSKKPETRLETRPI